MKMGHIISKLRYESGYSQVELAEKIGITKGAVGISKLVPMSVLINSWNSITSLFVISTSP